MLRRERGGRRHAIRSASGVDQLGPEMRDCQRVQRYYHFDCFSYHHVSHIFPAFNLL